MTIRLTFELSLTSDYHVSASRRAGPTVDSALLRDYDKAPLLRGTVLAGLLRDGLLDLLELPPAAKLHSWVKRDETDETKETAEVRLFGTTARRKRWAYSSARPIDSYLNQKLRWGAQDAMRVRVDPRTRRASPQKLFNQEEGDARLRFRFTATCPESTECDRADAALLVAAASLVRHLGASRRRGRGECRLRLVQSEGFVEQANGDPTAQALEEFKQRWLEADSPPTLPEPSTSNLPSLNLDGPRLRFRIIGYAAEPVIVARRSEAANAYETLSTIPGSALIGALANRAAHHLRLGAHDPPPPFVTLFSRGGARASGLLLAVPDNGRTELYTTIPAPLALFTCEAYPFYDLHSLTPHPVHDALRDGWPGECPKCGAKMKALSDFLTVQAYPHSTRPQQREEIHIRMERNTGRVKTGDLYEYIALEAGQFFIGELDCANETCWQALTDWTGLAADKTFTLRLGKASQRGYGLVHLVLQPLGETDLSPFTPMPLSQRIQDTGRLRMLFLTDGIVTDTWGRFYGGFDCTWVAEMLGLSPEHVTVNEFATSRPIDTFNTHRRMPRWRDEAIVAGATAEIELTSEGLQALEAAWIEAGGQPEPDTEDQSPSLAALRWKLSAIEAEGVGLRRHEGFGRVAFNHPIFPSLGLVDELTDVIDLSELPADFRPLPGRHVLETEAAFRRDWGRELDESLLEQGRGEWKQIDDSFEPVARLIYLTRHEGIDTLLQRLRKLQESPGLPRYLWGKEASNGNKEPKLDSRGLGFVIRLVERVKTRSAADHAIGLEILAGRIAIAADNNRRERRGR